jgi:hypothetical protein
MERPTVIGWWVAIAVSGLLYGPIAKSAGATISGSSVGKVFSKLGAPGTGADAVLGVCFLILAVLVAFVAAGQLTAARSEEAADEHTGFTGIGGFVMAKLVLGPVRKKMLDVGLSSVLNDVEDDGSFAPREHAQGEVLS